MSDVADMRYTPEGEPSTSGRRRATSSKKTSKRMRDSSTSSSSSSSSSSSCSFESVRNKRKRAQKKQKKTTPKAPGMYFPGVDEKVIPIFDPQQDKQSVEQWVLRVEELAEHYRWHSSTVVKFAAARLSGMARRWYDSQGLTKTWKQMRKLLVRQFHKPMPFAKLLKDAALYEATAGQDLAEYCFTKKEKLQALQLNIPEEHLVDAIIGGIPDQNVARAARSSRFTNSSEVYSFLSTMGKMPSKRAEVSAGGAIKINREKRPIKCFNCQGPHRLFECPKPKVECYGCGRLGHKKTNVRRATARSRTRD